MTDLETAIRDALQSRGEAVHIRQTALVRRRRRWVAPMLAAALVIALVVVTAALVGRNDASKTPPAGHDAASFVGYSWRLVQINDRQGRLTLPASTKAEVAFARGGEMTGDDTVNTLEVHYRVVAHGYLPARQVTSGGAGLAGPISSARKRTLGAIRSCFYMTQLDRKPPIISPVRASVTGNRLVLHTSDGVLTFVRNGTVVRIRG